MLSYTSAHAKHLWYVLLSERVMYDQNLIRCERKHVTALWKRGTLRFMSKVNETSYLLAVVYHLLFCLERGGRRWSLVFLITFWASNHWFMQNRKRRIKVSQDNLTPVQPLVVRNLNDSIWIHCSCNTNLFPSCVQGTSRGSPAFLSTACGISHSKASGSVLKSPHAGLRDSAEPEIIKDFLLCFLKAMGHWVRCLFKSIRRSWRTGSMHQVRQQEDC